MTPESTLKAARPVWVVQVGATETDSDDYMQAVEGTT